MIAKLRVGLTSALKSRDQAAVAALRSTLAAIANAEAVAPVTRAGTDAVSANVAGTVLGVGAADVPRRRLEKDEIVAVVEAEIAERETAAADYAVRGRSERAASLRRGAGLLRDLLQDVVDG